MTSQVLDKIKDYFRDLDVAQNEDDGNGVYLDFDKQGNYLSSRYWNALKFSAVHIRPDYYGVIKVKEK